MWSCGGRVLQELLSQPAARRFSLSPAQYTVVVERWWQVPLSRVGSPPRLHPRRHRIYKLVEDTKHSPTGKMELILSQPVSKLGEQGDTVFVQKRLGRNKLLPQGIAVYPSPENKLAIAEQMRLLREGSPGDRIQTRTGQMTVEYLKQIKLTIKRTASDDFQLTTDVVCRQFAKKLGVVVPSHALNLPFEPIKDDGDYWCEVTVNGVDTVRIPMSLLPYEDQSAAYQRQLKQQRQQQEAGDISEVADKKEAVLEAVSDPAVEAEAGKDSESQASASADSSAAEEPAATTQTARDTTAPPSESPKEN